MALHTALRMYYRAQEDLQESVRPLYFHPLSLFHTALSGPERGIAGNRKVLIVYPFQCMYYATFLEKGYTIVLLYYCISILC